MGKPLNQPFLLQIIYNILLLMSGTYTSPYIYTTRPTTVQFAEVLAMLVYSLVFILA